MRWTIRMHRAALAALYRIPRGEAATVTDSIRRLEYTPRPPAAERFPDRLDTYSLEAAGHLIVYELLEAERIVHVIFIDN